MRSLLVTISIGVILFAATYSFAGVWVENAGFAIGHNSAQWTEMLPGEDMDPAHPHPANIDWYPGPHSTSGGVRFYPSWNWGTPQAGDSICWLYDHPSNPVWWHGTFNNNTSKIVIQITGADSNDGWLDIYVDDVLEYSTNTQNKGNLQIVGTNFSFATHKVELRTRANGGDVAINYVATAEEVPTLNQWGLVGLFLLLMAAATVVIYRRRQATT